MIKLHFNGEQWWFTIHAKNHKILMTSEMYNSQQAAEKGIAAVKKAIAEYHR